MDILILKSKNLKQPQFIVEGENKKKEAEKPQLPEIYTKS